MSVPKDHLERIWTAGVEAVTGARSVHGALAKDPPPRPDAILAVGKAAASMAQAALDHYGAETPCLICTKYGHATGMSDGPEVIEAAHPVPDAASLRAGARAAAFVAELGAGSHLMMLVSGGASALLEHLREGFTLADLASENVRLLAAGLDIQGMNRRRKELSQIKGGGLLEGFRGARATVYAISDVEGDAIEVIGSGIGAAPERPAFDYRLSLVATNAIARAAAASEARRLGYSVLSSEETLYCDVDEAARRMLAGLDGTPGVRLWGGEPTVVLPKTPGRGGRNQALALLVAKGLSGRGGIGVIVGGTDGSDGPTEAAGGIVDGETWGPGADGFLERADSGSYLDRAGALFVTGPTGTNVMDLAVAITV